MGKQTPSVEWIVAESDADWKRLCPLTPPAGDCYRHWSRSYWGIGMLLLLLVGLGGGVWRMEQKVISQPPAKVTATMPPIPAAVTQGRAVLATTVISDVRSTLHKTVQNNEPAPVWDVAFSKFELWSQRAVVSIVITTKSAALAYRQTLFYQRTAAGWVRMEPDATQWGAEYTLETPNFVYHFRQNEEQTVATVAPQIDALYVTLQRNFGLPISPGGEKLMIDVSVLQPPGDALSSFTASKRFLVPSPARYLAPVAISDADLLAQSIALPLLTYVRAQAIEHYALDSSWQPLLGGLRLWQLWEMNLPLAGWREEIVRWLYVDLPTTRPSQPIVTPAHYSKICATHKLWLVSPLLIKIPLLCADRKWEESYWVPWQPRHPVARLEQFAVPVVSHSYEETSSVTDIVSYPGQTVVLATMVEYAVATYGRERLPTLVASLGQYASWETLIPAVYGVSLTEFEAGWQVYLAAHYGVAADIFTK